MRKIFFLTLLLAFSPAHCHKDKGYSARVRTCEIVSDGKVVREVCR